MSSEQHDVELKWVGTKEMLTELKSRYDAMVFLAVRDVDTESTRQAVHMASKGSMFACQSLSHHFSEVISEGLMEAFLDSEMEEPPEEE